MARLSQLSPTYQKEAKLDPLPFHLANLILHLLSALVVFALLRMLVRHDWAAGAGALLFALHPVQVEPVAWVTGMKDVLGGCLSLVAVWQYLSYARTTVTSASGSTGTGGKALAAESGASSPRQGGWHYVLATLVFVLALLAKPTAVVVPVVAWVLDYWVLRRSMRQSAVALVGWLAVAVPVVVVTKWLQPDAEIDFITPLWARPLVAADTVAFYLYKLVLPLWLAPDYGRLPDLVLRQGWSYFTWVVPCALAVLLWLWRERRPWLVASAVIFVLGVLPVSGLIPFRFQNISTVADRYLYFSMLGPSLALAWFISEYWGRPVVMVCALVLGLLGIKSLSQVPIWHDSERLWRHALAFNPESSTAHTYLGFVFQELGNSDEAIEHFRRAVEISPGFAGPQSNLAFALEKRGELDEAIEHFRRAVEIGPGFAGLRYNLAFALQKHGDLDEAIKQYHEALRIDPAYASAHYGLGNILFKKGDLDGAIQYYRHAVQIDPAAMDAYINLGNALAVRGDLDGAIQHYREAVKIDHASVNAYFNLGNVLARRGGIEEAIQNYREALRTSPTHSEAHFSLANALVRQGRLEEAIEHYQEAVKIKPDYAEAYHNLGRVLAAQGHLDRAIEYFRQAVQVRPDFAEAHESLSQALAEQGKRDEAIRHHQEALRILRSRAEGSSSR